LSKTDFDTAKEIAERIKNACAGNKESLIQCSIALGTASKDNTQQDLLDIVKRAEERMYKQKVMESKKNQTEVISSMLYRISALSSETLDHIQRLQVLAMETGRTIGLSERQLGDLTLFAALHDIGKAGMPDEILSKTGQLTPEEWHKIRNHAEMGYLIAHAFPELSHVAEAILLHHERWDGTGYPKGLKEDEIPLLVRILTIIDAYDVMTHQRSYNRLLTREEALEELKNGAGKQFDPDLVQVFINRVIVKTSV